jgi:hypothetical protein
MKTGNSLTDTHRQRILVQDRIIKLSSNKTKHRDRLNDAPHFRIPFSNIKLNLKRIFEEKITLRIENCKYLAY